MRPSRGVATLCVPVVIWLVLSRGGGIGVTPDSVMYWSAAQTILQDGVIATRVPRDPGAVGTVRPPPAIVHARNGEARYALTAWPPGYPVILAGLMGVTGLSAVAAAQVFAAIALALLAAALLFAARGTLGRTRATFAAALVACLPFVPMNVRMFWSDAFFTALAILTVALAARALSPTPSLPRLLLVAVTAAAATYVRYTGPVIMAAVGVVALVLAFRSPDRRALLWRTGVSGALFLVLVIPLFVRNLRLVDEMSGMHRPGADESIVWFFGATLAAVVRAFVPWVGAAVPGPRDALLSGGTSIAAWAITAAAIVLAVRRSGGLRAEPFAWRDSTPLLLLTFAVLHAAALLVVRDIWKVDFNSRMLLPSIAAAALLLAIVFEKRLGDTQIVPVNLVVLGAVCAATLASVLAADHFARWRGFNDPGYMDRPVAQWTKSALAHPEPGSPLRLVSTGYLLHYLHFATGASIDQLPDIPTARSLVSHPPLTTLVVIDPEHRGFRCPEYRAAYQRSLDALADSSTGGKGFRAWWISAAAQRRVETEHTQFTSLCGGPR